MNASQKQKYVSTLILESLAPYGFFSYKGAVWRYSPKGQFVFCVSCDLGRSGDLNEVTISFGSFYTPIRQSSSNPNKLFLGDFLDIAYHVRNTGSERPLLYTHLQCTFEEQVLSFLPYFTPFIPFLTVEDDPNTYLKSEEKLVDLRLLSYQGIPLPVSEEKMVYAYLSLYQMDDALRMANKLHKQYVYAANNIETRSEAFLDNDGSRARFWYEKANKTLDMINSIQTGDLEDDFLRLKEMRSSSVELCKKFFRAE